MKSSILLIYDSDKWIELILESNMASISHVFSFLMNFNFTKRFQLANFSNAWMLLKKI